MNTLHAKIERIQSQRARRKQDIRDGKIAAFAIIIAILAVMVLGASCGTQRGGCYATQHYSGYH